MEPELSVVIPVYNEVSRINKNIDEIFDFFDEFSKKIPLEVVFVNDGSKDGTKALLLQLLDKKEKYRLVSYDPNRGKGHAVRVGMLAAKGKWRAFLDIDLAVSLAEFERVLPILMRDEHAVILGNRSGKREGEPFARRFFGGGFRLISRLFYAPGISDFTCGFKVFRRDAAEKIFSTAKIDRWAFDTELIYLAKRYGFRIYQMAIEWKHDTDSRVRVIRDVSRSLRDLALIMWYRFSGAYR